MITTRTRSRRWTITTPLLVVIAIAAAVALTHRDEEVTVAVAPATYENLDRLVTTNGTVIPTNEFQARANFPGIVQKIYVELGDKVQPGQMLVSMKDPFASSRVASANSALEAAKVGKQNIANNGTLDDRILLDNDLAHAELAQAESAKGLAALKELQQRGAASAAEVESAQHRLESDNATLKMLRERTTKRVTSGDITSAGARVADAQSTLDSAKIQFDNANIRSPIKGTVYAMTAANYDFAPMGGDLLRVADLNAVEIRAYFDEPEIGKLAAGQAVKIVWDGRPGRDWHGHIKQAPVAAVVLGPRSVGECIITVDDAKEDLLPNTNVMVTVTLQQHPHVLTVPRAALHADGTSSYVFRIISGRLQRTPVDVGIVNLDRVEIARGLADGEEVALNALDNVELRDGLLVRTVNQVSTDKGMMPDIVRRLLR